LIAQLTEVPVVTFLEIMLGRKYLATLRTAPVKT
jgi:hypothetical protein